MTLTTGSAGELLLHGARGDLVRAAEAEDAALLGLDEEEPVFGCHLQKFSTPVRLMRLTACDTLFATTLVVAGAVS